MSSRQEENQTILPNGQINISLLQREISSELKSNDRSLAQESMKKKAIHSSKWKSDRYLEIPLVTSKAWTMDVDNRSFRFHR